MEKEDVSAERQDLMPTTASPEDKRRGVGRRPDATIRGLAAIMGPAGSTGFGEGAASGVDNHCQPERTSHFSLVYEVPADAVAHQVVELLAASGLNVQWLENEEPRRLVVWLTDLGNLKASIAGAIECVAAVAPALLVRELR